MFDVNKIRNDFSIFKNNESLVYLDSAATSLTPDVVVEEISKYYLEYRATVNRAMYENGVKADAQYNDSRQIIADYLNADFRETIFTRSTTSAMNLIARNLISSLNAGDEILVSKLEHHSTILPFRELGLKHNITISYIDVVDDSISYQSVVDKVTKNTKIVLLHHVSNVIGDHVDVVKICNYLSENNIISVVDGAQAITHLKVDVKKMNCDFYTFSAHKVLGPTGIGILYGKSELLEQFIFEYGGDMAHRVTQNELMCRDLPHRLEAGTPSIAQIIGLKYAFEYLNKIDFDSMNEYIYNLRAYVIAELLKINEIIIYNKDIKSSLITFNFKNDFNGGLISPHDALGVFSHYNVAVRGGHMCNMLTLEHLNVSGLLRASIYLYTTKEDVDKFIKVCKVVSKEWADYIPM